MSKSLKEQVVDIGEKVEVLLIYSKYLEKLEKDYKNMVELAENLKSDLDWGSENYRHSYSILEEKISRLEKEAKGEEDILSEIKEIKEKMGGLSYKNIFPIQKLESEVGVAYA